jgi:glutathione S-transferase
MSDELIFYTNPMSRGRIVRWMLEELGVAYETRLLQYGTTMKAAEYLAVNPMGKVPALVHGGTVVTEAAAICAYLADAFPDKGLDPAPTSRLRGPYYRWLFFTAGPWEAAATNKVLGFELPNDPRKRGMAGYGSLAEAQAVLEMAVDGRACIVGDSFTAADVYVGSHIMWGLQFGTLEPRPALLRYIEPLQQRPALARARAIDDQLLAENPVVPPAG